MAHFAKVEDGRVTEVIVVEPHQIESGEFGAPTGWVQTSYNTRGGTHYGVDGKPDDGVALRKNYAGIGYAYDAQRDAFIPPKPFSSWVLDEATCLWTAPTPFPNIESDETYFWDEDAKAWVLS